MQTSRTRELIRMLWVLERLPYFHLSHYYKILPYLGSPHLGVLSQSSIPNLLLWLYIVHQKAPGMSHACRPLLQEDLASVLHDLPKLIFWRLPSVEDVHALSLFSHVQLFATPWTVARQAPLSIGFSRQEYLTTEPPGKPSVGDTSPEFQDFVLSLILSFLFFFLFFHLFLLVGG